MERADIAKLWQLEEIAAAGHHELAANLRTAINELVKVRAAPEGRTDLERLESVARALDRDGRLGGDPNATLARTAIAELRSLRTRPVSCEACNAAAKRIEVLERECMASRVVVETEQDRAGFAIAWLMAHGGNWSDRQAMLHTARLATDENGGLGA